MRVMCGKPSPKLGSSHQRGCHCRLIRECGNNDDDDDNDDISLVRITWLRTLGLGGLNLSGY